MRVARSLHLLCGIFLTSGALAAEPAATANDLSIGKGAGKPKNNTKLALSIRGRTTASRKPASTLCGKVEDSQTKEPIVNAAVLLVNVHESQRRYVTETKQNGAFTFKNIDSGAWILTISSKDMLAYSRHIELVPASSVDLLISMDALETVDILRVTGKRTLIHPTRIGSSTNLDRSIITQYGTGNDLRALIESTPGIMSDSLGNVITRGEHNSINFELDGVVLPEAAGVLSQSQFVTPRSLQSMQVDIGGYEASDGGGPLGAVVRMRSLPITSKPTLTVGQQTGFPLAGNIYFNGSTAFSQDPTRKLYRLRVLSSGSIVGTTMGLAPPTIDFMRNNRADVNLLTKLEYQATGRDTFSMHLGVNESSLQVPTSRASYNAGVRMRQHDGQDYLIFNYKHKFESRFDEAHLHMINALYHADFHSAAVFDPAPVLNAGQPLASVAPTASRLNYVFGLQGDITKTLRGTHHLKFGFLDELRPGRTSLSAYYFNIDPNNASAPVGAMVSPFTWKPGGPGLTGDTGKYTGFRFVQSAYLQDSWRPTRGTLKRFTLDSGIRFDLYHGVFGNTLAMARALTSIPGIGSFLLQPFNTQRTTDAQASGRFGAAYVLTKSTVLRTSFSNLFMPPSVDLLSMPPNTAQLYNGIFNNTMRSMSATRGNLVDASIEHQIGPRLVIRINTFYKTLSNFGDSGVIGNTILYNRQEIIGQKAYGLETRVDLKPSRQRYGWYGFLSSTISKAVLTGSRQTSGGNYGFIPTPPGPLLYPDHDRRLFMTGAFGYRGRHNWWILPQVQLMTGLQDQRDPAILGPHPFRTPFLAIINLSAGYRIADKWKARYAWLPTSVDLRIENLSNNRLATNLGSPYQGTRYLLPCRLLLGCSWKLGTPESKLAQINKRITASL